MALNVVGDTCTITDGETSYTLSRDSLTNCFNGAADSKFLVVYKIENSILDEGLPENILLDLRAGGRRKLPKQSTKNSGSKAVTERKKKQSDAKPGSNRKKKMQLVDSAKLRQSLSKNNVQRNTNDGKDVLFTSIIVSLNVYFVLIAI